MTPDYERAALVATETLIKYGIGSAPVAPLSILKKIPGVLVVSYDTMSSDRNMERKCVMSAFGQSNQDSFTAVNVKDGKTQYIVTYNQHLSVNLFQRGLARELGHILLDHDGSRPEEVRNDEARCFANHLLCPRPLINLIKTSGVRLTTEVLGNLTGCYDYCLTCMRKLPATHVPAELNRQVREQFKDYFFNFFNYNLHARHTDGSAIADFGTYMDGYEE